MDGPTERVKFFEDYLKVTGWGLYNNFVVGLACACNLINAITFVTIPLAVVLSNCSSNRIPEHITLRIFVSFYFGSSIGGLVANFLADRYGRKRYLSYSLMFIFMSTFTAAFSYNAYIIIGAALILGVGLEAAATSVKLLLMEILPRETRGFYIIFCSVFWAIGYLLTSAVIIFVETPTILPSSKTPDNNLTTWRIVFAVTGGINLLLACACALIEESPRYFLQMGRSYMAYLVLKQMYAINNSCFAENFKVREDEIKTLIPQYGLFYIEPEPYWEIFRKLLWRFTRSFTYLFSDHFRQTTVSLIALKIPFLVLGVSQLNLVFAKELMARIASSGSSSEYYQGLDFVYPVLNPISYMSQEKLHNVTSICVLNSTNTIFYKYYLIIGGAMIPGLLITMILVDRVGRKAVLFASLVLISCSSFPTLFVDDTITLLILFGVTMACVASIVAVLTLVNLEAYPTAFRSTSWAVINCMGLMLASLFLNYIVIGYKLLVVFMTTVSLCLIICVILLPELKREPVVE